MTPNQKNNSWDMELEQVLSGYKQALVSDKSGKNLDTVFNLEIRQLENAQNLLKKMNKEISKFYKLNEWSKKEKTGKFDYELTLTYEKHKTALDVPIEVQKDLQLSVGGQFGSQAKTRFNGDFFVVTVLV